MVATCKYRFGKVAIFCSLFVGSGLEHRAWAIMPEAQAVQETQYQFDFPGGSLGEALAYIRSLSGLQYLYSDRQTALLSVKALQGRLTLKQAINSVIADLNIKARFTDHRTVIISPIKQSESFSAEQNHPDNIDLFGAMPSPIEEISVSSVRTTALGFKKISPTVVIEGDVFLRGPSMKMADVLYAMPSVSATRSAENTVYLSYGNGVNMLDLRAMGVVRTLVTVNGRRHVPTNGGEPDFIAVDTNMIPAELVDRVEVLTSGASVLYGADAIAGLVNVTLKDDFEGAQVSTSVGMSEKEDYKSIQTSALWGTYFAGDRGHYTLYANYEKQDGLKARDRFISREPAGFALGGLPAAPEAGALTRMFGYAEASESGTITGYGGAEGVFQNFAGQDWFSVSEDGQSFDLYTGVPAQRYNFASVADLISPSEVFVLNGNFSYQLNDDHQLVLEHTFGRATSNQEIAPSPIYVAGGQGIFIGADNPTVPEVMQVALSENYPDATGLYLNRRLTEVGNRKSRNRRDLLRLAVGIQGKFIDDWDYSIFYQYGQNQSQERGENGVDVAKVAVSVSPELCAVANGCSLTNYFGQNSVTADQADFIRTDFLNKNKNTHHVLTADVEGRLWQLPAGSVPLKLGLQYRYESLLDEPDEKIQEGRIAGNSNSTGAKGSLNVYEAYAALSFPLLKNLPLVRSFTVDAGLRYSHFSSAGSAVSWQSGFEYRVIDGFDIRGSYQEARRSPNISELFTGSVGRRFQYVDPCNGGGANSMIVANCLSEQLLGGVAPDFNQSSQFVDGVFAGNPGLQEERAKTENLGFTIDSRLWGGSGNFALSVDWFNIRVKDYIRFQTLQYTLNACYNSINFNNVFCGTNPATGEVFFTRNPETGEIAAPNLTLLNSGTFHSSGLDVDLYWRTNLTDWGLESGELQFRGFYSYNFQSEFISSLDNSVEALRGQVARPIHKAVFDTTYTRGGFSVNWQIEHRSGAVANPFFSEIVDGNKLPSITYHHASFNVELTQKLKVRGGIVNFFNALPPFAAFTPSNTFPEYYDTVGRRFYLGLTVKL